jgi:glycosyltransferase involved in cell wall biosynthesis
MAKDPRIAAGPLMTELGLSPQRYLLFASRLTPEKGCHDLIQAFNSIDTDMRLVVAGTSPAEDYVAFLKAQADPAKVIFAGHRAGDELKELFSNAYLFVLPSYIEGMSMALLEALSFGIAPLVSDIPENRAVVGDFGFYFPPQNQDILRQQLEHLLRRPEQVNSMAVRLDAIRQPDWTVVAERYDQTYRAALRSHSRSLMSARPANVTIE